MARGIVFPTLNIGNSVVFSLVDDPDVARSIIDRDIARLEEKMRALNSRRNELSPISRLPPEPLCTVFSFIEDWDGSIFHRSPKPWINFSITTLEIIGPQCAGTLD